MPEYLAPGVYVEEVSFRSKSIEGVSTTTTGFVGPTRYGPIDLETEIVTSVVEFERLYGDRQQLAFGEALLHNFLWHAVRAFFEEGGKRLYVARAFRPLAGEYPPADLDAANAPRTEQSFNDGHARGALNAGVPEAAVRVRARFPGAYGNLRVRFTLRLGPSVLAGQPGEQPRVSTLVPGDVVWITDQTSPIAAPPGPGTFYLAESFFDAVAGVNSWRFRAADGSLLALTNLTPSGDPAAGDQVRVATLAVSVSPVDDPSASVVWDGLALAPGHIGRDGSPDSLSALFEAQPEDVARARSLPIVVTLGGGLDTGLDLAGVLVDLIEGASPPVLFGPGLSESERSVDLLLAGGNDGLRPEVEEYQGRAEENATTKSGLMAFEDLEDISIVAAPGSTFGYENGYRDAATAIQGLLISHASRLRYRIAVLDSGDGQAISQVRAMRGKMDSTYAALYYPWVRVLDPVTRVPIHLPPSGFVAGIYARNDVNRGVYKAPANEVVNLAIGFEQVLNKSQQDVLNPEGVNCFRFFEGRGFRLWGARTISSDPEWKYVNLRRYFAYLERSIDKGTQWVVFEPNGERLWANVRRTVEDFLFNEWVNGALLGEKPERAYFVKCDRSTMTQNDLDNGRLVCLVGVAPLRPAEFVIFRIGQWTGDRKP